jgi:hypothetical protein
MWRQHPPPKCRKYIPDYMTSIQEDINLLRLGMLDENMSVEVK